MRYTNFQNYALDSGDDHMLCVVEGFLTKLDFPNDPKERAISAYNLYCYAQDMQSEKIGMAVMNQLDKWSMIASKLEYTPRFVEGSTGKEYQYFCKLANFGIKPEDL